MRDSGFTPEQMLDVHVKINQVIMESQPHEVSIEDLLMEALVGKMIADPNSDFGNEFVTVMSVRLFPSRTDPNGVKIIATVMDDNGEPYTVWLGRNVFFRKMDNPKFKVNMISKDNIPSFLESIGVDIDPDQEVTPEMLDELGFEEADFNEMWQDYLDNYEDHESEIEEEEQWLEDLNDWDPPEG